MIPAVLAAIELSDLYDLEPSDPRDRGWFRLYLPFMNRDGDGAFDDAHVIHWHDRTGLVLP